MKIEEKIKKQLEEYGFKESDLTVEELETLKQEIEAQENGETLIDGVLSSIDPYREKPNNMD